MFVIMKEIYKLVEKKELNICQIVCYKDNKKYCALKLPLLKKDEIEMVKTFDFVYHISQVENIAAKQKREEGYCEIIFGKVDSARALENQLDELKIKIPHLIDEGFYSQAKKMLNLL